MWTHEAYPQCEQCHGERPACAHCARKGSECRYDIEEGVTRQQDLRTRLSSVQEELNQMKTLVHQLRHGSVPHALQLLARLRTDETVARLVSAGEQHSTWYERSTKV